MPFFFILYSKERVLKNLFLILVVSITSSAPLICQQANILHIVNADTQAPVPFAIVSNQEKSNGGYANEEGVFALSESDLVNVDSLLVSAIGYQDAIVDVQELSLRDTIRLVPSDLMLSEVVVTASSLEEDDRSEYLGVSQKKNDGQLSHCAGKFGSEYAIRLVKRNNEDEIDQLSIYLVKGGVANAPFRIKIYSEEMGRPSNLLHSVVVQPTKKLKKWTEIPLTKEQITIGEKIFYVAFEWLSPNEDRFYFESSSGQRCNGQILGLSTENKDIDFLIKTSLGGTWWDGRDLLGGVPMIKVKMK